MKQVEDRLNKAIDLVQKRFDKNDANYCILVCAFFALLKKYDGEFFTILENVFNKTNFVIEDKEMKFLLEEYGLINSVDDGIFIDSIKGVSMGCAYFDFYKDGKVYKEFGNSLVLCSKKDASINTLLNTLIHEISHLIKGTINGYTYDEYNYFSMRTGFCTREVSFNNGEVVEREHYSILEEVVNTFQTSDMMMDIEFLKSIEVDDVLYQFLSLIDFSNLGAINGYGWSEYLIKDLWENELFRNILEDEIVVGDIIKVINSFNEITGGDYFDEFADLLDDIDIEQDDEKLKDYIKRVREIISLFNSNRKEKVIIKK